MPEEPFAEAAEPAVISHRPSDAFRAQLETLQWFRTNPVAETYAGLLEGATTGIPNTGTFMRQFVELLAAGESYWVSPEMCEVLQAAYPSMPDHRLSVDELPCARGVCFFAKEIIGTDARSGTALRIGGVGWAPTMFDGRPVITMFALMHRPTSQAMLRAQAKLNGTEAFDLSGFPPWEPLGWSDWPIGDLMAEAGPWHEAHVSENTRDTHRYAAESAFQDRQILSAIWTLSQQRMADVRQERIDRPTARTFERRKITVVRDSITVVRLRRATAPAGEKGEPREVAWSHRWIVGGHWREQWYPSRGEAGEHHPIWISPYVKGPDDKPIEGGPTVKAWVR